MQHYYVSVDVDMSVSKCKCRYYLDKFCCLILISVVLACAKYITLNHSFVEFTDQ